jgi:ABC-type multidrug transport system ATPase subunit
LKWSELFNLGAWKLAFTTHKYEGKVTDSSSELIRVSGLRKKYENPKVLVFEEVNFYVNEGEVIVIIGPNGAGKTTLVNILAGAVEPDAGLLEFQGMKPSKRFKIIQNTLGIVFQENIIFEKLSVREHLELFGTFKGINKANMQEAVDFFAENLQLTHMLETYAGDLSGGQKRKLCIAISLLGNPPIVIMDEPTAGVDVQARQLIWKTIAMLRNTTSIITSHALEEAETVSSRLFIVADQQIPFCGTSTELRNLYKCGYLLRVDRVDGTAGEVLELAQRYIPASHLSDERKDTIRMPVDHRVADFLSEMIERKEELGIHSYSFAVEQLEDMLLKMIETGQPLHKT